MIIRKWNILIFYLVSIGTLLTISTTAVSTNMIDVNADASYDEYLPDQFAELTTRSRTKSFIESTRAIPQNNASALDSLYYRVLGAKILDKSLSNITTEVKSFWISQILSFQNSNGGFGGWKGDSSTGQNTAKAIETLKLLGVDFNGNTLNTTLVLEYIERLRNSLTGGYNSHLQDTDSDIFSTFYGIKVYSLLNQTAPNESLIGDLFVRAQNLDSNFVSSNEIGGFGDQTNSQKGIYWTSKVSTSNAAIFGADMSGTTISDDAAAISFLKSLQTVGGGFTNDPYKLSVNVAYTASALESIDFLGNSPTDQTAAINYILSLEQGDGSFKYQSSSSLSTLKASYYAVEALNLLGSEPSNVLASLDYFVNWNLNADGYGAYPGDEPSLIKTFDAVGALDAMGIVPSNVQGILDYVETYRNNDGGYGILGSYMDSTSRVVAIYNYLGQNLPNSTQTISFINSLYKVDGAYTKSTTNSTSLVVSTYRAVVSLNYLSGNYQNQANTIAYIKSCQNTDGGFGGYVGDISDVSSTYRSVKSLSILGNNDYNKNMAISFLQGSQNPDGGFKRSSYDIALPNNVSHAVYSYSASFALLYMNAKPLNVSGLYNFVKDLRNNDGGYGKHKYFTSENSYTFTSLTLLRYYQDISGFVVQLPSNLDAIRSSYSSFNIVIQGESLNYDLSMVNDSSQISLLNASLPVKGNVTVNTENWAMGSRTLDLTVVDHSGVGIHISFVVFISEPVSNSVSTTTSSNTTNTTPTNNDNSGLVIINYAIIGALAVVALSAGVIVVKKKSNK